MKTIMIYGRSRFEFAKHFPQASFEGYEGNIRFCYFSFKNKISDASIKRICQEAKIKILDLTN